MKNPFIMHLLVALVWLFLSGNTTLANFAIALGLTFLLLALFQKPLHCQDYVRRTVAFFVFLGRLIAAIIASNLRIMRVAVQRDAKQVEGFFVDYDTSRLTDFEILLLSICIGLSPGTIVADRLDDGKTLVVHGFGAGSVAEVEEALDVTLTAGILSFTR